MKAFKLFTTVVAVAIMFAFTSCGEKKPDVKVSPEMEAFMKQLTGTSDAVGAALTGNGVEGLDTKDMGMYELKEATVVSADKDCYTMEAAAGMTVRTYVLCWEGGKIKSIEDKGMK